MRTPHIFVSLICFRARSLPIHTHNLKCNFHSNKLFKYCMQLRVGGVGDATIFSFFHWMHTHTADTIAFAINIKMKITHIDLLLWLRKRESMRTRVHMRVWVCVAIWMCLCTWTISHILQLNMPPQRNRMWTIFHRLMLLFSLFGKRALKSGWTLKAPSKITVPILKKHVFSSLNLSQIPFYLTKIMFHISKNIELL